MSSRRVILQLDSDTEPVSGTLHIGPGPGRRFEGYVGLISALEVALGHARSAGERLDESEQRGDPAQDR
ncbi:MAG: hypothetical protein ACLP01_22830 [Solirubrobacteraceae bacterium]